MNCRQAQTLIHKELDGETSVEERRNLSRHLETCQACGAKRDSLRRMLTLAREIRPADSPPDALAEAVIGRLRRRRRLRLAWVSGLSAAAAILLCLALWPEARPPEPAAPPFRQGVAVGRAPEREEGAPQAVEALSPEAAIFELVNLWRTTVSEVSEALPSSVEVSLLPEGPGPRRGFEEELRGTKNTLLQLAREVGEQVLPFELQRAQSRRQNG